MDFDSPTDKSCNKTGKSNPLPLEYFIAGGDSGGGLFIESDNKWFLAGISSYGGINIENFNKNGYYGNSFNYIRISFLNKWINEKMKEFEKVLKD